MMPKSSTGILVAILAACPIAAAPVGGGELYKQRCAMCHDTARQRVPARETMAKRSPEELIAALTTGRMKVEADGLGRDDVRAIAFFLTGKEAGGERRPGKEGNVCGGPSEAVDLHGAQWNGWGRDVENSRFQPNPGLKPEDIPKLKVKWAFGYPGTLTYGQPTIIGNRLYVSTQTGLIYSLNAQTGCTWWEADAGTGVRTAISVAALPGRGPGRLAAFFGDDKSFVHAVDAVTGKTLWTTKVDDHAMAHITGAPVLYQDRIYVPVSSMEESAGLRNDYACCTFRGSVAALDARTGKLLWKTYAIAEVPRPFKKNSANVQMYGPAGAAVWSAPTLDTKRKLIYFGTGNSYTDVATGGANAIVALDMKTGSFRWANQVTPNDNFLVGCDHPGNANCPATVGPDVDFGSSPILRTLPDGKQVILAGQKSGVLYALDPDRRGKILWKARVGQGSVLGGIQWGPAADNENVYVAISDLIPQLGHEPGGLTALNIATGETVWHTPAPKPVCSWGPKSCRGAQSAAVTAIPGAVFSGSMDGRIRAYSTRNGYIVWDYDTARPYETINGVKASGGSLDVAGPTVANGVLYVNSGYGQFFGQHGNVLLAFTVNGQ